MKYLMLITVSLLLAGCREVPEEPEDSVTPAQPRTLVYSIEDASMQWDSSAAAVLFERNDYDSGAARYESSSVEVNLEGASFSFSGLMPAEQASAYFYDFIYPSGAVSSVKDGVVTLDIPSSQTPGATFADPAACPVYGRDGASYPSQPSYIGAGVDAFAAFGKIVLKQLKLAPGETLQSVTLTVEGCDIAGQVCYDLASGEVTYPEGSSSSIFLSGEKLTADAAGFDVWFACKPFTAAAGTAVSLVTKTSNLTHSYTFATEADLEFRAGEVTTFEARPEESPVTGRIWYVSARSGDDGKDGLSPSSAFKNLHKALSVIAPGDQVRLMPGTWSYAYDAMTLNPEQSGKPGQYISFVAHDPLDKPVIHVGGSGAWNAIKCYASYIIFDGIEIAGDNAKISQSEAYACAKKYYDTGEINWNAAAVYNANGISITKKSGAASGPTHVIVRNCEVHDMPGAGIGAGSSDYITFENNQIYNCAWFSMYANSGISFGDPYNSDGSTGHKMIIRGNTVSGCHAEVPWARRGNSFSFSDGNGIIIDVNTTNSYKGRTLVQNNVSFNNGGSGIHTFKANHVDIVGNTAYYNGHFYNGSYGEIWANQSDDVHIYNNIMVGGRDDVSSWCNLGDSDAVYRNNIYWNGNIKFRRTGDLEADPMFVNASTDRKVADFHLQEGSPAIGHGTDFSANPATDRDGNPRSPGFDCGAYQFVK